MCQGLSGSVMDSIGVAGVDKVAIGWHGQSESEDGRCQET